MLEAYTKLALNFYYFMFCDEPLAITGAARTIGKIKKIKNTEIKKSDFIKILLSDYKKINSKLRQKNIVGTHQLTKSQWLNIDNSKLQKWKNYLKYTEGSNCEVLALRYLLDFSCEDIAQAMGVPKGTILYRLGRGLEQLSIK